MENKYKKLLKSTSVYALGTFGSKVLVFLIVPLYTYVLSTSDYGIVDLITSTISLLIPFTTLLIYEAAIRFLVSKETDEKKVFNNCMFIFIIGCLISLCLSPIVLKYLKLIDYMVYFILLLILNNYTTIFGQFLRAKGDNWGFSISGIINTLFLVLLNLLFLLYFKKGLVGYLYSLLISQVITSIFIFIRCKTIKLINHKCFDVKSLKKMLIYSYPLIPNNIMWWIMNAGDKYVINYYLGSSFNGIFSISYKVPTIITMFFSIFMQAWQVSAIEEKDTKEKDDFYKNVFKFISAGLIFLTSIIIIVIKPLFNAVISSDFISSWKYVPLLCVATLFNCFSTFAGVVYIINKNSKKSFYTTFIGALVNLTFNFLLIQKFGLFGVAIGTILGYITVMILRFKDYKNYFHLSLFNINFVVSLIILLIESTSYILFNNYIKYIVSIICILAIFFLSKDKFNGFINVFKNKYLPKK